MACFFNVSEVFVHQSLKLLGVHVPCSHNHEVFSHEIVLVELFDLFLGDYLQVLTDSQHGLADEMVSETLILLEIL